MMKTSHFSLAFHTIAFAHHVFTFKFILANLDYSKSDDIRVREIEDFGPRYLTTWNMVLQTVYLFLAIWVDVSRYFYNKKKYSLNIVRKYKGYLYSVLMFPTTLTVAVVFWSMYWINREWVLPEVVDTVAPKWINHSIHTNILIVLLVEFFLVGSFPRPDLESAMKIFAVFGLIYYVQYFYAYYQFGRWLYGLYYVISWPQRIGMVIFLHFLSSGFLKLGYELQNMMRTRRTSEKCQ